MDDKEYKPISKRISKFRSWCVEKWYQHKDEIMDWERRLPDYDDKHYFQKNKWLLRRMFREEMIEEYMEENKRAISKQINRGLKKGKKK